MDFFGVVEETTFLINRGRKKRAVIIYQTLQIKKMLSFLSSSFNFGNVAIS